MNTRRPYILTLNAGSSSIKFGLYVVNRDDTADRVFEGEVGGIGLSTSKLTVSDKTGKTTERTVDVSDYVMAARQVIAWSREHVSDEELAAIGHRIVHGGPYFDESCVITEDTLNTLHGLTIFDPLHLPNEIDLIKTCMEEFAQVPQIACFDTAFHYNMPAVAHRMALPREYEDRGLRRYGFHGLSCTYILNELRRTEGVEVADGRIIIAHLGSGASLTAIKHGQSQDTTMALTPAAGIPMSTRSGDIDPGIVRYLAHTEGQTADEFDTMINERSGLLGVSGTTPDMEELLKREADDYRAKDAIDLFCYAVKKQIGALAAAMGGCDTIVFTGGMGENAPRIRARISEGLDFLGVQIDTRRNNLNKEIISVDNARITVRMLHTDENQVIAQEVIRVQGDRS